jgi:hypothetical protein
VDQLNYVVHDLFMHDPHVVNAVVSGFTAALDQRPGTQGQ